MPCSFIFSIEIIFVGGRYLIVVKGDGSLVWYWPDDGDGSGSRYPAVGDVDRDGDLEIGVVGDGLQRDLNLSLLHHNQLKVSGWPYAGEVNENNIKLNRVRIEQNIDVTTKLANEIEKLTITRYDNLELSKEIKFNLKRLMEAQGLRYISDENRLREK